MLLERQHGISKEEAEALPLFEEARAILERLVAADPDDALAAKNHAYSLNRVAAVLAALRAFNPRLDAAGAAAALQELCPSPSSSSQGVARPTVRTGATSSACSPRSSISSSNGVRRAVESYVGWPTDLVARKVLRKDVLIGREALEQQLENGVARKLSGVVLEGRGVLRPGYKVVTDAGEGLTTSGTFSPTLEKAIALARVPADAEGECQVEIRGKRLAVRRVKPPFVRNGQAQIEL